MGIWTVCVCSSVLELIIFMEQGRYEICEFIYHSVKLQDVD